MRPQATPRALAGCVAVWLALALPALGSLPAAAGPWTLNRGGYYATSVLGWQSSTAAYDAIGEKVDFGSNTKYLDRTISLRTEYGVSDRVTLELGLPVRFLKFDSGALPVDFSNSGFGDARAGLRIGVLRGGPSVVSLQLDGQTQTGYDRKGFGIPPLGDGKSSVTVRALAGRTFAPRPAYVQGDLGYRFQGGTLSDALVGNAEAGVWASPRFLVLGTWQWQEHRNNDQPFEDFFRYGGQAQYRYRPGIDLIAGLSHVGGGQNTFAGTAILVGVALKGNTLGAYRGPTAAGSPDGK